MTDQYLLMWLEAPLQSWGHDSKFGRRDTLNFPTKSGVFGMLCCALGAGGEQRELLEELADLNMQVFSFIPAKREREPLLRDFHMVGSGYNDREPWENLLIPKTSEGKKAVGGGTKLTYRYYLQDAHFAVILHVAEEVLVERLANALQNPVWDLYLGRKNCAPTDFIYRGLFAMEEGAQNHAFSIAQEKKLIEDFRVLDGPYQEQGEVLTLNDIPIQFGQNKQYRDRFVTVIKKYESDE